MMPRGTSFPDDCFINFSIYIYTRETPAFSRIFLALRGSGTVSAAFVALLGRPRHLFGKQPSSAAVKENQRKEKLPAPHSGRR